MAVNCIEVQRTFIKNLIFFPIGKDEKCAFEIRF